MMFDRIPTVTSALTDSSGTCGSGRAGAMVSAAGCGHSMFVTTVGGLIGAQADSMTARQAAHLMADPGLALTSDR